jgi:two-component system phosphate regulon sensor histidine kinase PhoR
LLSLRLRISFSYLLLTVVALLALGLYIIDRLDNDFRRSQEDGLLAEATLVRNAVLPLVDSGDTAEIDRLAKQLGEETRSRIAIIGSDGSVLGESEPRLTVFEPLDKPEVQEALNGGVGRSRRNSTADGASLTYVALRAEQASGEPVIVRVARSTALVDASLDRVRDSLLIALAIVAAGAVALGVVLSRSILRPLGSIEAAAASMAQGDMTARVQPRPAGEVGQLADAFNQMADTVQEQMTAASQERSRLTALLNSSVDAVVAVNAEGGVLFANLAAERLFQRPAAAIVSNPFGWTLPDDQVISAIKASRERNESQVALIERPGRQYLQVVATPIRGGGDWTVVVVFHDLTDVKRTEQVRRDFIANVSHELRTPLAGLKAVIETLADGAVDDPKLAQDFLDRADNEVDRLVQMVEELLELSRIESGNVPFNITPTDVELLLQEVAGRLQPQAERKHLTLSLDTGAGLADVPLDASRIEHAVVNLVQNAIKFTPEGGSIVVHGSVVAGELVVAVTDTGIGIAPADLPRIFERFYKADQSRSSLGSGLGLALVKHTVEGHGGQVRVESVQGQGSRFSFTIPVRKA